MAKNRKYRDPPGVDRNSEGKSNGALPILDRKLFRQSLPSDLLGAINEKKQIKHDFSSSGVVISKQGKSIRSTGTRKSPEGDFLDQHIDVLLQLLHKAKYPNDLNQFFKSLELTNKDGTKRAVKGMPLKLVRYLQDHAGDYAVTTSKVLSSPTSLDGSTTKLAIELHDGQVIETVIMRHEGSRNTICVSSQVGCAMQCSFCATGTMGIRGNLCHGEIVEQLVHASRYLQAENARRQHTAQDTKVKTEKSRKSKNNNKKNDHMIRNVVFMGMGEPLNNYPNVIQAARDFICRGTWSLQYRHVCISTVGVVPNMIRLTRDLPDVSLALSLHAPFQEMRLKIVPTAKHYPIEDLMDALDNHMRSSDSVDSRRRQGKEEEEEEKKDDIMQSLDKQAESKNTSRSAKTEGEKLPKTPKKRAMIEYVMLEGDTSTLECAHELGRLCQHRNVVVNLIPYNPTNVKDPLKCPSMEKITQFQNIITSYGCWCFVRRTMGQDIAGACGQLANVVTGEKTLSESIPSNSTTGKEECGSTAGTHDIEDGPFGPSAASRVFEASKSFVDRGKSRSMLGKKKPFLATNDDHSDACQQENCARSTREGDTPERLEDVKTIDTTSMVGVPNESQFGRRSRDLLRCYVKPLAFATTVSFVCTIGSIILHLRATHIRERQMMPRK